MLRTLCGLLFASLLVACGGSETRSVEDEIRTGMRESASRYTFEEIRDCTDTENYVDTNGNNRFVCVEFAFEEPDPRAQYGAENGIWIADPETGQPLLCFTDGDNSLNRDACWDCESCEWILQHGSRPADD